MQRVLPSLFVLILGCHAPDKVVPPGPPIPPEHVVAVESMEIECSAFIGALNTWKLCPNLEPDERETIDFWIEHATNDFAVGAKAKPDAKAQESIAVRCRRARDSVRAATERCSNGHRPKQ